MYTIDPETQDIVIGGVLTFLWAMITRAIWK